MPRSTQKSRRTGKTSARTRREPPRLVLDTNVWISALLWAGPPNEILRIGESKRIVLVASPSIVEEAREVLARSKFALRIAALERAFTSSSTIDTVSFMLLLRCVLRAKGAPSSLSALAARSDPSGSGP